MAKRTGQRSGYVQVSTLDQNAERQLDGVIVDRTFLDRKSGKDVEREQLDAMIEFFRHGDSVVVHSMDRLARNLDDLRRIVITFAEKGVRIEFVKESLSFTSKDSPMPKLMLSVMGAVAEFKRSLIRERQREGITRAKQRGIYRGRKRVLSDDTIVSAKTRIAAGDTKAQVARDLGAAATRCTSIYASANDSWPEDFYPMPSNDSTDVTQLILTKFS